MNITPQKQFDTSLDSFKKVSLTIQEKEVMKKQIIETARNTELETRKSPAWIAGAKTALGIGALSFVIAGSVVYASADSDPGDTLYLVEVYVAEPLVGIAKISAQEKQEYQLELAQERIIEYETITEETESTAVEQELVQELFQEHILESQLLDEETIDSPVQEKQEEQLVEVLLEEFQEVIQSFESDEPQDDNYDFSVVTEELES